MKANSNTLVLILVLAVLSAIVGFAFYTSYMNKKALYLKEEIDMKEGENIILKKQIKELGDSLSRTKYISDSLYISFVDFQTRTKESAKVFNGTLHEKVHAVLNASDSAAISTLSANLRRESGSVNQ